MVSNGVQIVWFRRDLRLFDNPALHSACKEKNNILCLYILDEKNARPMGSAQKWWLHHSLIALNKSLKQIGLNLSLHQGCTLDIFKKIIKDNNISAINFNTVFEPEQLAIDAKLEQLCTTNDIQQNTFHSNVIISPDKILNGQNEPYKVFTSFYKKATTYVSTSKVIKTPTQAQPYPLTTPKSESLQDWALCPKKPNWANNFKDYATPGEIGAQQALQDFMENSLSEYKQGRDFPEPNHSSRLSAHIHFGEISLNQTRQKAVQQQQIEKMHSANIECFIRQLYWRDFSYYLLFHNDNLPKRNFNKKFDNFPWKNSKAKLKKWQTGQTGYPIVDAGMRELWHTGYMHNRVRMITASFLTKHLLIHWKKGEEWFWDTLLDADLANNVCSWQWVQGCGADAAPYFRIFNPTLQGEKFDPDGVYVKKWIPELSKLGNKYIHTPWLAPKNILSQANITLGHDYPCPIVDHKEARILALESYKNI